MKTKHTPGPWLLVEQGDANEYAVLTPDKKEWVIAFRLNPGRPIYEQEKANAKLIAAAPELLEALKVCYASLCTYGNHPLIEKQVESAIKKATE